MFVAGVPPSLLLLLLLILLFASCRYRLLVMVVVFVQRVYGWDHGHIREHEQQLSATFPDDVVGDHHDREHRGVPKRRLFVWAIAL